MVEQDKYTRQRFKNNFTERDLEAASPEVQLRIKPQSFSPKNTRF